MADVFVSYSRRDTAYVERLVKALEGRGKDVWVDVEGIRDAEVFPAALRRAVEGSDAFVFVISPDSVHSAFCEQEVDRAVELNKRVVPLALRPVPDAEIPDDIRYRNWIPAGEDGEFASSVERLVKALDTDLDWEHRHTRLTVKALEWNGATRDRSFALRGSELRAGEEWLAASAGKDPGPTQLEREYLLASRAAATRRQRVLVGASIGIAAVSIALLVFALISRSNAISARNAAKTQALTAKSQALAADSQNQLVIDPERSVLLAADAVRGKKTPEALFALRAALDASPIRFRLPDAGIQNCNPTTFEAPGVAFSPDGSRLAEGLCNGNIVFADGRTGRVTRRVHVGLQAGLLDYNRDGSLLAAAAGQRTALVDPATGSVRIVGHRTKGDQQAAFSPVSANELAIAGTGHVTLWNARAGRGRTLAYPASVRNVPALDVAFSPDGRRLAVSFVQAAPGQPSLILMDASSGRTLATTATSTDAAAFSPNGRHIVAAQTLLPTGGGRIAELDPRTLKLRSTLQRLPDVQATAVAVSPDGSRVAFGGADGTAGLLALPGGRTIVRYVGQTAAITHVAFSPDGTLAATTSQDGTLRAWLATGQELRSAAVGFAADDVRPTGNGFVVLGQGAGPHVTGVAVQTWAGGKPTGAPLQISPTTDIDAEFISADGRLAGVIPLGRRQAWSGPVRIWSVARRRVVRTVPPSTLPFGGAPTFSPDARLIAMGKPPGTPAPPTGANGPRARPPLPTGPRLVLVDARTGRNRQLGTTTCANGWRSQPFSRDGRLVAGGAFCGQVYVWNVATGRPVGHPFSIGGELAQLAFSPDATRIAAASWNSTVTVADVRTGKPVAVLTDHTRGVPEVEYSPDGRYLASASLDGTVRIWDARSLRPLRVLHQPGPAFGVTFTRDSRRVIAHDNTHVSEWDACTACGDANALLALARTRVTRQLTPQERRTFGAR